MKINNVTFDIKSNNASCARSLNVSINYLNTKLLDLLAFFIDNFQYWLLASS